VDVECVEGGGRDEAEAEWRDRMEGMSSGWGKSMGRERRWVKETSTGSAGNVRGMEGASAGRETSVGRQTERWQDGGNGQRRRGVEGTSTASTSSESVWECRQ
jgi:hypothetical protein